MRRPGVMRQRGSPGWTMRDGGMLEACFYSQHARVAFGPRIALESDLSRAGIERATQQIHEAVERLHEMVI